jgi:hypothetical protein
MPQATDHCFPFFVGIFIGLRIFSSCAGESGCCRILAIRQSGSSVVSFLNKTGLKYFHETLYLQQLSKPALL